MINTAMSQELYRIFMDGKVINKNCLSEGSEELIPNRLYSEVIGHWDEYEKMYGDLGFKVKSAGNSLYLVSVSRKDGVYEESSKEAQLTIELLSIGLNPLGIPPTVLVNFEQGLTDDMIEEIAALEIVDDIKKACNLRDPLLKIVKNKLENRELAYRNSGNRLVLSDAGTVLFDMLTSGKQPD